MAQNQKIEQVIKVIKAVRELINKFKFDGISNEDIEAGIIFALQTNQISNKLKSMPNIKPWLNRIMELTQKVRQYGI